MDQHDDQHREPNPLANTPAYAVASFINDAAHDDAGCTMATAMFVLSLWQTTVGPPTTTVPSVFLVNAGDAKSDPLDDFVEEFVFDLNKLEQRLRDGSNQKYPHIPGDAQKGMFMAVHSAQQLSPGHIYTETYRNQFHNYRSRDYGDGPAYRYARAWTEQYGWLSGSNNRLVLRLHQAEDSKALREDVLTDSNKLSKPQGFGAELKMVSKKLAFSGSLHSEEWDEPLVTKLLISGRPVLFLPHTVMLPLQATNKMDLYLASTMTTSHEWQSQVMAEDLTPEDPWTLYHFRLLSDRLAYMPMDYAFTVQRLIRELGSVCMRFAYIISGSKSGEVVSILGQDLFRKTLRAITIGVFGLAYHGWGFNTGCPREVVAAMLHHVRKHGTVSRRELQRKIQTMNSVQRDEVIARLEAEGLLECNDQVVSAMPLADFIEQLQSSPRIPKTGALSCLLLGRKIHMADPLPGLDEDPPKRRSRRRSMRKAAPEESEPASDSLNQTIAYSHT